MTWFKSTMKNLSFLYMAIFYIETVIALAKVGTKSYAFPRDSPGRSLEVRLVSVICRILSDVIN